MPILNLIIWKQLGRPVLLYKGRVTTHLNIFIDTVIDSLYYIVPKHNPIVFIQYVWDRNPSYTVVVSAPPVTCSSVCLWKFR